MQVLRAQRCRLARLPEAFTTGRARSRNVMASATALDPLDERELMVTTRAYALSGVVLVNFAMLGCFYTATAGAPGLWHPRALSGWINLDFGFQAGGLLLPTWIASWLQPRPDHEG